MFDQSHYVPVLKGREGEYGALKRLRGTARAKLTPVIEVPPVPWDFAKKVPQKSVDTHIDKVADKLFKSWGTRYPIFLDTLWLSNLTKTEDGSHALTHILQMGRALGLKIIPVTGFMREPEHVPLCRDAHRADKLGICVRLLREDLAAPKAVVTSALQKLLQELEVSPRGADLLIDLRDLKIDKPVETSEAIDLIRRIPSLSQWRTFTICGTSFPSTLADIPVEDCTHIERSEWELWKSLQQRLPEEIRRPTFGDYAIAHPEPSEVDPRIMKASAAIRYTSSDTWIIIKGRGLKKYKFDQFHALSQKLTKRVEYKGSDFSWGDGYIEGCGRQALGTGNLTTWRQVGTSHHLAFVLDQIANLFDS